MPQRVEAAVEVPREADAEGAVKLTVRVRDPAYAPLDNAAVTMKVTGPDGKPVQLTAEEARILGERLLKLAKSVGSLQSRDHEEP